MKKVLMLIGASLLFPVISHAVNVERQKVFVSQGECEGYTGEKCTLVKSSDECGWQTKPIVDYIYMAMDRGGSFDLYSNRQENKILCHLNVNWR